MHRSGEGKGCGKGSQQHLLQSLTLHGQAGSSGEQVESGELWVVMEKLLWQVILPQWGLEGRLAQPRLLGQSSTGILASLLAT